MFGQLPGHCIHIWRGQRMPHRGISCKKGLRIPFALIKQEDAGEDEAEAAEASGGDASTGPAVLEPMPTAVTHDVHLRKKKGRGGGR